MNEHAPGWYQHDGERRYWDGEKWTQSVSVPSLPPHDSLPVPPPAGYGGQAPVGYGGQAPPFAPGMMPLPRKEPALSLLASFLLPGVGQIVNGDVGAGVTFLCVYFGAWVFFVCGFAFLIGFLGLPVVLGAWIWSMVDAYQGAVRYNQRAGYPG